MGHRQPANSEGNRDDLLLALSFPEYSGCVVTTQLRVRTETEGRARPNERRTTSRHRCCTRPEIHDNGTLQALQSLVNGLQAVTDVACDTFSPAWRQILIEMSAEGLFGKTLKERAEQILAQKPDDPGRGSPGDGEDSGRPAEFYEGPGLHYRR